MDRREYTIQGLVEMGIPRDAAERYIEQFEDPAVSSWYANSLLPLVDRIPPSYLHLLMDPDDRGPYKVPFGEIGIAAGLGDGLERHATLRLFHDRLHFRVETDKVYAERSFVIGFGKHTLFITFR